MVAGRARRTAVVLAFGILLAALALLPGRVSGSKSAATYKVASSLQAHGTIHERGQQGDAEDEAYADRAYPGTEVTIDEIQGAIAANGKVAKKSAKLSSKWDFLGPDTLDVDRLGTQAFNKATQWSGRVTALTVDP